MPLLDTENKRKSMTITVVLHVILLLLLFYFGFTYLKPPPENGIAVNFGAVSSNQGGGSTKKSLKSVPKKASQQTTTPTKSNIKEKVVTQQKNEAPVIKKESTNTSTETISKKTEEKKPEPQPNKATADALSNLINAPKSEGENNKSDGENNLNNPNGNNYYKTGIGLDGDKDYQLGGRRALNKEKYIQECNEAGKVVVSIEVDRNGKVISATPGVRGTKNNSKCLLEPARRAALATRFNPDPNAPSKQIGKIIYNFRLSN